MQNCSSELAGNAFWFLLRYGSDDGLRRACALWMQHQSPVWIRKLVQMNAADILRNQLPLFEMRCLGMDDNYTDSSNVCFVLSAVMPPDADAPTDDIWEVSDALFVRCNLRDLAQCCDDLERCFLLDESIRWQRYDAWSASVLVDFI